MNVLSKISIFLFLALTLYRESSAQPSDIPRLRHLLLEKQSKKSFTKDTAYIDVLDSLAYGYYRISADSVFFYAKTAAAYAKEAGYGKGESVSLRLMGNGYGLTGDYANMLSCYQQALAIGEKINNPLIIGKATINIAIMYDIEMGEFDEALVLLKKAADIFEVTGDSLDLVKALTASGAIWVHQKLYEKALANYQRSLKIATSMKNEYLMVTTNDNIGLISFDKGLYKESLHYSLPTLGYFEHTDDKMRITKTATTVAETYFHLKFYSLALKYAMQSLQAASAIKGKLQMKDACKILADIYGAKGDTRSDLKYLTLYNDLSESLYNEAMLNKTGRLEARYEYEKREARLKEEQNKKDTLHQHFVRVKELEMSIAALLILFLTVLTFVLFRSRATKHKINQILQENNEKIEHQAIQLFINNQEKDKLFSIIAHDLKEPLYSLKEMLALLKMDSIPEASLKIIMEELRTDVDFSAELVNNLLFWAGSQLNGRVVSPVAMPLQEVVSDSMRYFERQASEKGVMLKNELPPALSLWADKTMIQVMIRNLVSNAIKFCNPGDTITIEGKKMNGAVEICVADTGIGIGEDILKKIALKESVTTYGTFKEKGTGLGLLLCREFAEANHGLFRVESAPDKGSRFYFTLPLSKDV
jgi:two-component system sensor histidine kinase/response regulator